MDHSIKHYLFKLKWPFAILIFVVFTGFVGENCMVKRFQQWAEISKLKNEIDEYNRKFEADKKVLMRMKYDPDASAEVAREKYLMKKPDEDIYVFDSNAQ